MAYLPAQHLRLYRNFKAIDAANYYGIIRYFEQYEDELRALDDSEYFDCAYTYSEALYAVGLYGQAIVMLDHLIEWVIVQNITRWGGQDILARLLARKAEALTQQRQWPKAEHVWREYLKLYAFDRRAWDALRECLLRQRPPWLSRCWAICMGLFFAALTAAATELFVVRPFFYSYNEAIQALQHFFIGLALAVAIGAEGLHTYRCRQNLRTFANHICAQHKR